MDRISELVTAQQNLPSLKCGTITKEPMFVLREEKRKRMGLKEYSKIGWITPNLVKDINSQVQKVGLTPK